MAATLVQTLTFGGSASTGTVAGTWAGNPATGNLIVVLISEQLTGSANFITSITDTQGNTYSKVPNEQTTNAAMNMWYAWNITGGTTPTITINTSSAVHSWALSAFAREYSNVKNTADPLDTSISANSTSTGTASAGPTATLALAGELVIAMTAANLSGQTSSTPTGYADYAEYNNSGSTAWLAVADNLSTSSTAAQSVSFVLGTNWNWSAGIATFLPGHPSKLQSAIARIQKSFTKTQPAITKIQKIFTKTQTSTGRIQNAVSKTQTAIARSRSTGTTTQTAKATIIRVNTKTQAATGSVVNTGSKTQVAHGAIGIAHFKTQTGVANIVTIQKTSVLQDSFDGSVISTTKWSSFSGTTTVAQNNGINISLLGETSTSDTYPSTVVNNTGAGAQAWTSPANAEVLDTSFATVTGSTGGWQSNYLWATGFGFAIPVGATISGVKVTVHGVSDASSLTQDMSIFLIKGGAITGSNKVATPTLFTGTAADLTYGGAGFLWSTSLAPSDVNGSTFGVAFQVNNTHGGGGTASVNAISMTVYYNFGGELVPSYAGTTADYGLNKNGVSASTWTTPTNAETSNAVYTSNVLSGGTSYVGNGLKASNFGFSVPTGATINGIKVEYQGYGTSSEINQVNLMKAGAIDTTAQKATTDVFGSVPAWFTQGSTTDLWADTWTASDINNTGFGVIIFPVSTSGTPTMFIDAIRITVFYTFNGVSNAASYAGIDTALNYDLTNSYAFIETLTVPNQSSHAQLYMAAKKDSSNQVSFVLENGTLNFKKMIAGTTTTVASVTYDAINMRWWRLREALGTVYWDTASDAVSWTSQASLTDPFALNNLKIEIAAGTYQDEINPGTAMLDNYNIAPTVPVQKSYLYKVYNQGTYLGLLPEVTTDFSFSQELNTAGAQITVACGVSADTSAQSFSQHLLTEAGDIITAEDGTRLTTEGAAQLVGPGGSNTMIMNGNRVHVFEYSQYNPNGKLVFSGQIQRWEASFGGNNGSDTINVLIYSDGFDLDNYVLLGSPYTADVSQTTGTNALFVNNQNGKLTSYQNYGQTWQTGVGITNLGRVDLKLSSPTNVDVTVSIYASPPTSFDILGTLLAQQTINVNTGSYSTPQIFSFSFTTPLTVTASTSYFIHVTTGSNQGVNLYSAGSNVYSNGTAYNEFYGGGSSAGANTMTDDLYFVTYSYSGSETVAVYTAQDPSTGMLENFMNNYKAKGGNITYTTASIDATGLSLNYTFNTNTVYEGITTVLSLAPDGFYYYVDVGSNILYFKQTASSPDFYLTKGRHINSLTVIATIESIANLVYFSGGLVSGSNLFKIYQNTVSINNFGQRLERESDNRVTVTATADALGASYISEKSAEQYQTTVSILDGTMDISGVKVGQIVGFNGFGTFIDNLTAQIVRLDYYPEHIDLTLGILPKRLQPEFEKIKRGLIAQQTIDNPS